MDNYRHKKGTVLFELAVVPFYRARFFSQLQSELANICDIKILTAPFSLDKQVHSDLSIPEIYFQKTISLPLRFFWQRGYVKELLVCDFLVCDKNPRSLNAWFYLVLRRIGRRKTYLWGHSKSRTNNTRISRLVHHLMNLLASGIFLYTKEESSNVHVKKGKIHIAPNSIMFQSECFVDETTNRNDIVYSGRLEKSKDLEKLIRAFSSSRLPVSGTKLIIIGEGSCRKELKMLVNALGYASQIEFLGEQLDSARLRKIYASARFAVGPGYGGLNITQANCFGVPIILDKFGKHSPEIALKQFHGVIMTDFTSIEDMSRSINIFFEVLDWDKTQRKKLAKEVSQVYCISNMIFAFDKEIRAQIGK